MFKFVTDMIAFPGCKINLGLNITQKLSNGYHTIESAFIPISLSDVLEIIKNPHSKNTQFFYTGIPIPGNPEKNLIKKAYDLLAEEYPLPAVKVHLHKMVPMGAGLGGGSADASAMLVMLNQLFKLNISESKLIRYAKKLGADCPFFIINKPALVSGIGEIIKPFEPDIRGNKILLVYPQIAIRTAEAFQHIKPQKPEKKLSVLLSNYPIHRWKEYIKNDFENFVFKTHPEIAQIKDEIYQMGAEYASLSGSGSVVYGIFEKDSPIPKKLTNYFTYWGEL